MSGISSPLTALRWNSQELFTVRRSSNCQVSLSYIKYHVTYWPGKTPSQTFAPRFWPFGRSPPGFQPPVSRFRTPASFWSQIATFQIWRETVKPRGATLENVFFPCFALFSRCLCFTSISFFSCTLLGSNLAGCLFGRWSTCVLREMVRQWKSRDLSVSENLISDHVFFPPVFNPPVCKLRTPASFWSELVTY